MIALWAIFTSVAYWVGDYHYLTPFYSPCVSVNCTPGSDQFGRLMGDWYVLSPALLILVFPLGFRMTCYYYRKAYYRSFWASPPACAGRPPRLSWNTRAAKKSTKNICKNVV